MKTDRKTLGKPTEVGRKLLIDGYLWSGARSQYSYPLRVIGRLVGVAPLNMTEVKRIAGDFDTVVSASLVTTEVWHHEKTSRRKIKI